MYSVNSTVIWYIVSFLIVWHVLWYIIYNISGFHLRSISFSNGVLIRYISLKANKFEITILKAKLVLWGGTRKLVLDGICLNIKKYTKEGSTTQNQPKEDSTTSDDVYKLEMFPKNRHLKSIVQYLIKRLPNVDVEIRDWQIKLPNGNSVVLDFSRLTLNSRKSNRYNDTFKFSCQLHLNTARYEIDSTSFPVIMDTLKYQLNWQVDLNNGDIHRITAKVYLEYMVVHTFALLKDILATYDGKFPLTKSTRSDKSKLTESELVQKLYRIHRKLYSTIDEVSFNIENVSINDLPLIDAAKDPSIDDYFSTHEVPNIVLQWKIKSIAVNYQKLSNKSPAFQVLFDHGSDNPFHLTLSIQLFKLYYKKPKNSTKGSLPGETTEILVIPQFGFTFKSNVLDRLARGEGFKDCVMELFTTSSSPIIDLDIQQLTSFAYNANMLSRYFSLKKTGENHVSHTTENETRLIQSPTNSIKKKIFKLLRDTYPKLEVKISFEQPRFIIRDELGKRSTYLQLMNFLYSFLNIHLITTSTREYDVSCNFLNPTTEFIEKKLYANSSLIVNKTDVFKLKSVSINLEVLKNFKIKPTIKFTDLSINVAKKSVIEGIGGLLQDISRLVSHDLTNGLLNLKLNNLFDIGLAHQNELDTNTSSIRDKLFKKLPFWLLGVEFFFYNISITFGSRSIFISSDVLVNDDEDTLYLDELLGDKELRSTSISLKSVEILLFNEHMVPAEKFQDKNKNDDFESKETSNITTISCFWATVLKFLKFSIDVKLEKNVSNNFVSIPLLEFKALSKRELQDFSKQKVHIESQIDDIAINYDRYSIFTILGSIFLLNEYIVEPLKVIKQKIDKEVTTTRISKNKDVTLKKKIDFISCNVFFARTELLIELNDDFKVKGQFLELNLEFEKGCVTFDIHFLRFLTTAPTSPSLWTRLLVADSLKVNFNVIDIIHFAKSNPIPTGKTEFSSCMVDSIINIESQSIRLIQPHDFVVYQLFNNISISVKTLKHLVQSLFHKDSSDISKHKDKNDCQIVVPKQSNALKIPPTRIKSKRISFSMEDDPFESELTMIYQLGLTEQRKRLEKLALFTNRADSEYNGLSKEVYEKNLGELYSVTSRSWIRRVKVYKAMLNDELVKNKKYLFGNESHSIPSLMNRDIIPYSLGAPLLLVNLEDFDLLAQTTKFPFSELPQFLYDIGQNVPKDTKYSLMIPTYLQLKLGELRVHARDYPLPILHVPANVDASPSLTSSGHLIISENLVSTKEHLREILVPLIKNIKKPSLETNDKNSDIVSHLTHHDEDKTLGVHRIVLQQALSTVKIYSDMKFTFLSTQSSRFIWGQSYQFALQQIIMNFDQFSKPPVDPLKKLGIWDKMRYIVHGNFTISVADEGELQIAIKGSRDPYNLFGTSSGFVLSFKDSVEWRVNQHDDPKLFFEIVSNKVSFFVPNYLAVPLYSWTRPSDKAIYMPDSQEFISSTFAFYLEDIHIRDQEDIALLNRNLLEKNVLKLEGGVNFQVGFLLQRKVAGKKYAKTYDSLPHYEVELYNPIYTKEGHDSYKGFRSDFVHMAISLTSDNDSCSNSIHLSPGVFKQLFSWWALFAGNMNLPIRKGTLFKEKDEGLKLSRHLFTNKFLFKFRSVYISHIYRDETVDMQDERIECIGIRAKVDDFILDLHQRKESRYISGDDLQGSKKIQKMTFNLGQSHLKKIDLRTVYGIFNQDIYNGGQHLDDKFVNGTKNKKKSDAKINIFDEDISWFDIDDYEEVFIPTLKNYKREIKISPILYTECFSYSRDTSRNKAKKPKKDYPVANDNDDDNEDDDLLGLEDNHDCKLDAQNLLEPLYEIYNKRISDIEARIRKKGERDLKGKLEEKIQSLKRDINEYKRRELTSSSIHEQIIDGDTDTEHFNTFNNRFILISMLLKWNIDNRNIIYKYIQFVQWRTYFTKYLKHEAITTVQELINKKREDSNEFGDLISQFTDNKEKSKQNNENSGRLSSEERLQNFQSILREVDNDERSIAENFLIEIISPQIQLQNPEAPDSILLIAAPNIDVNIISVVGKSNFLTENETVFEDRYGILMKDANIFVLDKGDMLKTDNEILVKNPYGSKNNWPPWLGIEVCKNGSLANQENLLVQNTSSMVIYEKIKPIGEAEDSMLTSTTSRREYENSSDLSGISSVSTKLLVDIPKFVVTSTSQQYSTLYMLVMNLLFYTEPINKNLSEILEKLKFSIDFQDLDALQDRLVNLHQYHNILDKLAYNYQFRHNDLDNESLNNYLHINLEKGQVAMETYLLLRSIISGDNATKYSSDTHAIAEWVISADQIIFHLLQDDRSPILDIAMASGKCFRTIYEDGSNSNKIGVYMMQAFNLLNTAIYPQLFGPLDGESTTSDENLITVRWKVKRPVGGIKIIENFEFFAQPLNVRMDDKTGEILMKYIFQSEDISDSPIIKIYNENVPDDDDDDSEDSKIDKGQSLDAGSDSDSVISFQGAGTMADMVDGSYLTNRRRKKLSGKYPGSLLQLSNRSLGTLSKGSGSDSGSGTSPSDIGTGSKSGSNGLDIQNEADVIEMVSRAKKYVSIENFNISPLKLMISIKCHSGTYRILNVQDFVINLPIFDIKSEVISAYDFTLEYKKIIIKTLLSHIGKLVKNKFTVGHRRRRNEVSMKPLRPIKKYVKYTKVAELRVP